MIGTAAVLPPAPVPAGFALIPAGTFEMGDAINEGDSDELPVHDVYVSAFYMAQHETTRAQWLEVANWANSNDYDIHSGGGKGANHPVCYVNWYDILKWCNARSQKDGLPLCYTVNGAVFKTGTNSSVTCNFAASGYRLPTEAEWEKAARGGLSGKRYPWGDTISHGQANYRGSGTSYGNQGNSGHHPTYNDGSDPYSSPVGSFAPNGYGLYDTSGNMAEYCWDRYGSRYYESSPASDPLGPGSGAYRVIRGGTWLNHQVTLRAARRNTGSLTSRSSLRGFRAARSSVPQ